MGPCSGVGDGFQCIPKDDDILTFNISVPFRERTFGREVPAPLQPWKAPSRQRSYEW